MGHTEGVEKNPEDCGRWLYPESSVTEMGHTLPSSQAVGHTEGMEMIKKNRKKTHKKTEDCDRWL